MGIPPSHPSEGLDRLSWHHTSTGAFSIKSAYKMMKEDSWNSKDEIWKRIWKLTRPQRVDPSYPIYGHDSEDILHIIRDCTTAKEVWKQVVPEGYEFSVGEQLTGGWTFLNIDGHDKVIIQSDNLEVTKAIHGSASKISNSALVRRIHHILSQEGQWILHHSPREHNRSSDYLAKLAFAKKEDLQLICSPPREVLEFLKVDNEK
ncbi:hypothetical protein Gotri_006150, partial [Gossypium trilobum]|nr:hypothetical protein [Gossypium trilobum]